MNKAKVYIVSEFAAWSSTPIAVFSDKSSAEFYVWCKKNEEKKVDSILRYYYSLKSIELSPDQKLDKKFIEERKKQIHKEILEKEKEADSIEELKRELESYNQ